MAIAFLFPGQGAQTPGFLGRLPAHPRVQAALDEASAVLGRDARLLDSSRALESTVGVQLSALVAGVAVLWALEAEGVVGVQLVEKSHMMGSHVIEFLAVGTAVHPISDDHSLALPQMTLSLDH